MVPLDLRSAPDYVARVVSRTEPKLAFTSRFTPKGETDLGVPEIAFEELEGAIAGLPEPEDVDIRRDDLAEIMFTSGTTGDPKGVMLTHRNLTANIEGITQYISCEPSSRLLSILPLSHMYEQMGGLFVTLYYGASVTYPTSRQPTVPARTMRERKITIMLLVPQGLELLMERDRAGGGPAGQGGPVEQASQGSRAVAVSSASPDSSAGSTSSSAEARLHRVGRAALDPDLGRKWEMLGGQDRTRLWGHRGVARHQQSHHRGPAPRLHRPPAAKRGGEGSATPARSWCAGRTSPPVTGAPRRRLPRPSTAIGTRRATWGISTTRDSCISKAA